MGWTAPIFQGIAGNANEQAQKAQYQFNAKSETIAADQDSAARLNDLNSTLSAINAIRTSNGLSMSSPTGMAIAQGTTQKAEAAMGTSRLNYMTKAQSDQFAAWGAGQAGTFDLIGGFLQSYDNLGKDVAQAAAGGGGG